MDDELQTGMLNGKPKKESPLEQKDGNFKDALIRLLTNKVFMYNFGSSLFYVFAFMGLGTFMPKYMEYQYRMKGSTSSAFTGAIGTISKAIGLLGSGFAISRWKFSARLLSGWNCVLGFMFFITLIAFANLGCPSSNVPAMEISACNQNCQCPKSSWISPICAKDGVTNFYSPCMAGCQESSYDPNTKTKSYSGCSCIRDAWLEQNMSLSKEWILKGKF